MGLFSCFQKQCFFAGSSEDQMHFNSGLKPELFEQANTVNGAARTGDPDYDFQIWLLGRNHVLNSEQKRYQKLAARG
jgi:hypothetical protein